MGSQDESKGSANLLRRSLRDAGDACPEPEILAAYFERSLDADETAHYELHLSQCARCREQLAAMHHAGEAAPAGAAQSHQSSHWAWLWDWRFLAPAVAVLVIAAVWIARRPASQPVVENSARALVAMKHPAEPPAASLPTPSPEQYSNYIARVPSKTLTAPAAGASGAIKQNPALTESRQADKDKEFASNQPAIGNNATELDDLKKVEKSQKRDSADTVNGVAAGVAASRIVAPAAAAPPPPAAVSPDRSRADGGAVGGVILDQEIAANRSEATKAKPSGSPTGVRTLTQQAQTQAIVQSEALALEASDRRSTGDIITTPDPKVLWRIVAGTTVELSKDGGTTWQSQQLRSFQANPQITTGYAPTAKICWLVGRGGVILLTRDAAHWVPIPPPISVDFVGVTAQDNFSATVTTADGRKFSTDDAGDHWKPAP